MSGHVYRSAGIALILLRDEVPVIGPVLKSREEAVRVVETYLNFMEKPIVKNLQGFTIDLLRQIDGRYTMIIRGLTGVIATLRNVDELMLKRLWRGGSGKRFFILTSFFENERGEPECLALTEGMGAVVYESSFRPV